MNHNINVFMLFAPKFSQFGVDVAKELLKKYGGGKIFGICVGPLNLVKSIENSLGDQCGKLWHLHTEEQKWLTKDWSMKDLSKKLSRIDNELGVGTLGRFIVADRRVGKGFVRGGLCRPDTIAQKIETAPQLQPQKYIAGLYNFIESVLDETQPNLIFCYAVAGAPALALAEISQAKGIVFARLNTTRIGQSNVIDDSPTGQLDCVARTYKSLVNNQLNLEQERVKAKKILEDFRSHPEPPEYTKRNQELLKAQNPLKITLKALLGTPYHLAKCWVKKQSYLEARQAISRNFFGARVMWKKALLNQATFTSDLPTKDRPFIYFPLHVDPEASTMVLSPWHTDQISVIESLAKSAPAEMIIVVKEHAPMLGKRPRGFYEKIATMPRVILIGPEHNGLSIVQKAELTAVITGTAAWEAIRLGKPTLIIGNSPFLAIGEGMIHEPCLANLPSSISKALTIPSASDEALELYLTACLAESFEMSSSLLWGKYEQHSEQERQKAVNNIVNGIEKRITEFNEKSFY